VNATLIYVSSTRDPVVQLWATDAGRYVVEVRESRHGFDYLPEARAFAVFQTRAIKAERKSAA
jgi:hypothetical protein